MQDDKIKLKALKVFVVFVLFFNALVLSANDPKMTADDYKLIPDWCGYTGGTSPAPGAPKSNAKAEALVGQFVRSGCGGIHHYCWALVWAARGDRTRKPDMKIYYYDWAISDFGYASNPNRTRNSCLLLPEMKRRTGDLQRYLGNFIESVRNYREAIVLNPSMVLAYSGLSGAYVMQDLNAEAISIIKEGLKANPNSSFLKKRLQQLESEQKKSSEAD